MKKIQDVIGITCLKGEKKTSIFLGDIMKSFIIALTLLVSATAAHATNWGEFTVQISVGQTIAAVVQQTLNASSHVTSQRYLVAQKIQADIQDYGQTGVVSPFLTERIALVQSVNPELSEQDSIDVLIAATNSILI
jgi:hypothetical protein